MTDLKTHLGLNEQVLFNEQLLGDPDSNPNIIVQPNIPVSGVLSRLIESMYIEMGPNTSRQNFLNEIRGLEKILKKKKPVSYGTKDRISLFYLKHNKDSCSVFFRNESDIISGLLEVSGYEVDSIYIENNYRGKNLGTVLYLTAIRILGKLKSSFNIGIMAVRTWKSVSKYYEVQLKDENDEAVKYEWGSNGIPVVNGKPITAIKTDFYFEAHK